MDNNVMSAKPPPHDFRREEVMVALSVAGSSLLTRGTKRKKKPVLCVGVARVALKDSTLAVLTPAIPGLTRVLAWDVEVSEFRAKLFGIVTHDDGDDSEMPPGVVLASITSSIPGGICSCTIPADVRRTLQAEAPRDTTPPPESTKFDVVLAARRRYVRIHDTSVTAATAIETWALPLYDHHEWLGGWLNPHCHPKRPEVPLGNMCIVTHDLALMLWDASNCSSYLRTSTVEDAMKRIQRSTRLGAFRECLWVAVLILADVMLSNIDTPKDVLVPTALDMEKHDAALRALRSLLLVFVEFSCSEAAKCQLAPPPGTTRDGTVTFKGDGVWEVSPWTLCPGVVGRRGCAIKKGVVTISMQKTVVDELTHGFVLPVDAFEGKSWEVVHRHDKANCGTIGDVAGAMVKLETTWLDEVLGTARRLFLERRRVQRVTQHVVGDADGEFRHNITGAMGSIAKRAETILRSTVGGNAAKWDTGLEGESLSLEGYASMAPPCMAKILIDSNRGFHPRHDARKHIMCESIHAKVRTKSSQGSTGIIDFLLQNLERELGPSAFPEASRPLVASVKTIAAGKYSNQSCNTVVTNSQKAGAIPMCPFVDGKAVNPFVYKAALERAIPGTTLAWPSVTDSEPKDWASPHIVHGDPVATCIQTVFNRQNPLVSRKYHFPLDITSTLRKLKRTHVHR